MKRLTLSSLSESSFLHRVESIVPSSNVGYPLERRTEAGTVQYYLHGIAISNGDELELFIYDDTWVRGRFERANGNGEPPRLFTSELTYGLISTQRLRWPSG